MQRVNKMEVAKLIVNNKNLHACIQIQKTKKGAVVPPI